MNKKKYDMVVDIFLAPDDGVLVSVQSRTRRFETVSKSYKREVIIASTFCKAMLGYLPLLPIALLGCYKAFLICSPKCLRKLVLALFVSLLVLLKYID